MPLYFFHMRDRTGHLRRDDIGSVFENDAAAVTEAIRAVGEVAADGKLAWQGCAFEIYDAEQWLVATVPVATS